MANRFLSTFGALSIFALLVSFRGAPEPAARIPAKAIAEIPITHHFSQYFASVGVSGASPPSLIATMPAQAGIAIAQLSAYSGWFSVRIDGNEVFRAGPFLTTAGILGTITINPPLIAPPGSLVEIGLNDNPGAVAGLTVTGYTLDPAYFGT